MIDNIGRGALPRATVPTASRPGVQPGTLTPTAKSLPEPVTAMGRIAKDLATSPPVDAGRVAALRQAIQSGSYRIDPDRIAERMIALERPFKAG